jgi:hypothetical protein
LKGRKIDLTHEEKPNKVLIFVPEEQYIWCFSNALSDMVLVVSGWTVSLTKQGNKSFTLHHQMSTTLHTENLHLQWLKTQSSPPGQGLLEVCTVINCVWLTSL